MAIKAKQIIDTAVDVGKSAVSVAERRIRGRKSDTPSGGPSTVGAAEPGNAGGPKSATASKRAQKATASTRAKKAKPKAKAKTKPAKAKARTKPAKAKATPSKRSTARRAAASSGKEVSDAAKNT
jgi:hypothetical protein